MSAITVQQAIDRITVALQEAAKGAVSAPEVYIRVDWTDVSTSKGREWIPNVYLRMEAKSVVKIEDL